jgi:hypothetical protein
LADVAIDVADAVFPRNVRKVAGPGDALGALEFGERLGRIAADMAIGRVVDDEIQLRPILRRLADIRDIATRARRLAALKPPWTRSCIL